MYTSNRNDMRQTFFDVWRKLQSGEAMTPLETVIAEVIRLHPEYHPLLADAGRSLDRDWLPDGGETNPFLHLGLHIAIREQVSIDRPPGIRAAYETLLSRGGGVLEAEHEMLECLAEALWRAQRENRLPDEQAYLACVQQRVRSR